MEIEERTEGDVTILFLRGKMVGDENAEMLHEKVEDLIEAGSINLVLDLADVPDIDSAGLGEILHCHIAVNREGGKLKSGNPTLGSSLQGSYLLWGKVQAHRLVHKCGHFVVSKAQVMYPYLGHMTIRTQARQGQGRIGPAGDDQVQPRWRGRQMVEQKGKRVVNWLGLNNVVVVEDEDIGATRPFGSWQACSRGFSNVVDEGR